MNMGNKVFASKSKLLILVNPSSVKVHYTFFFLRNLWGWIEAEVYFFEEFEPHSSLLVPYCLTCLFTKMYVFHLAINLCYILQCVIWPILGIHGYEMFFDIDGEVKYPFRLHHFGTHRKWHTSHTRYCFPFVLVVKINRNVSQTISLLSYFIGFSNYDELFLSKRPQ